MCEEEWKAVHQDKPEFHLVNCCMNCQLVFRLDHWDDEPDFYCRDGAPPVPPSDSTEWPDDRRREFRWTWERWAKGRQVPSNGICDNHRKKTKN